MLTSHVFDKVRELDINLTEFRELVEGGEVIEETAIAVSVTKEVVLLLDWVRRLHAVVVIDDVRQEERIVTVYEPDPALWSVDFRRRRR